MKLRRLNDKLECLMQTITDFVAKKKQLTRVELEYGSPLGMGKF